MDDKRLIQRAEKSAKFILDKLLFKNRLHRIFKDEQPKQLAYLNDYAFFIAALLDLYEASHDPYWLSEAMSLNKIFLQHFEDKQAGGFYLSSDENRRRYDQTNHQRPFYLK
ncbi:unnamed protein product [marine sediment metagenome]|uniref:Thioredoxin domain-containing protein n=1 Tax=marine sediment metagenome TaxID=412755 RepID=X1AJF7_9ZZZZ